MTAAWEPPAWDTLPADAAADGLRPGARAAIDRAVALMGGSPRCCPHVQAGAWLVCAHHQQAGLACPACFARHLRAGGHDGVDEHRCDVCGRIVDDIGGLVPRLPRPRKVRPPRAAPVRTGSEVLLAGLGICPPCADRLTGTRPRAMFVLPEVREADPPGMRNAVAARNAATVAGTCPACGAAFILGRVAHGVTEARMVHEDDCPVALTVAS